MKKQTPFAYTMLLKICFSVLLCGLKILATSSSVSLETKPMKILVSTSVFPKISEPFVVDQVIGLLACGHDVYVHAKSGDFLKMHEDVTNNKLIERTYYDSLPKDLDTYDIILCQFGPRGIDFLNIKKELHLKAKVITYFRGYDITEYLKKHPHCYDDLFKEGDFFLSNCEYFRQMAITNGCDPKKILVHYSAIDLERFKYHPRVLLPNEKIRILTTGRLVEKKGIEYALYAIESLVKKYPNLEYHIVGDGYYKERLEKLVAKLKLEPYVTFFGAYTQDELVTLLQKAHIFVSPSTTAKNSNQDAIPNTIKEAMALGMPIISTMHGGIPEMIIDEENGFLVPEKDSIKLAETLEYLLENPEVWNEIGLAARHTIEEKFDTNTLRIRLATILRQIIDNTIHVNLQQY